MADYGPMLTGSSNVIIVAPHAYLPDWEVDFSRYSETDYYKKFGDCDVNVLIPGLIILTGSSGIFNTVMPRKNVDFNKLTVKSQKSLVFRTFLDDLSYLISRAKKENVDKPIFVLLIHSFPKIYCKDLSLLFKDGGQCNQGKAGQPRKYQIDLGCGLLENTNIPYPAEVPEDLTRFLEKKLLAVTAYNARYGKGQVTCSREVVYKAKKILSESYRVTIGREWAANRKNNLLQYLVRKFKVEGIQVEIVNDLIKSEGLLISLKQVVQFLQSLKK